MPGQDLMATANRRVPLSCEPCRERKIRCYRNSPASGRTCDTCVRRGIPLEECIFLRDLPRSQRPMGRRPLRMTNSKNPEAVPDRDLSSRVEKLESLLSASSSSREHTLTLSTSPSLPPTGTGSHHRLSRTASGHERFEPFPAVLTRPRDEAAADAAAAPPPSRQFAFTITTSPVGELLLLLPPLRHCDALKDLYFRVFGSLFHILHDPTFEQEYAVFRANPQGVSLTWLALLYAVLAVAVTAMDETDDALQDLGRHADPLDNLVHLTSTYRAAAMRCLDADHYLWQHNLETLQTLVLLIYGISHSHGPSWALLGVARNIAESLGCQLDPDEFNLGVVEAEQRRKCWAALCMMHTVQNATLGCISSSPLSRNVKLPLDLDDDELEGPRNRGSTGTGPTQMTYLIFKLRLYDLFSRISEIMGHGGAGPDYADVSSLHEKVAAQQDLWSARYMADTREGSLPGCHAAHLHILSGYAHQLRLLLHRPVILQQQSPAPAGGRRYSPAQVSRSRDRCIESARALLDIHGFLHDSPAMRPYQWYNRGLGSFHAFHAAATIAFVGETCTTLPVREVLQLGQQLDNTVMVFQSISDSGMSVICRKALPVVQQFQKRINSLSSTHARLTRPVPEYGSVGLLSPELQDTPTPEHIDPPDDFTVYTDALFTNMQATQWLSPSTVMWDTWNDLVASV